MTLSRLGPLTHILIALLVPVWWSSFTGASLSPGLLAICGLLGLLPDIDSNASSIGRLIPEASRYLERTYGHRTLTHSLLATTVIAAIFYFATTDWPILTGSYASHLLLDMIVGGNSGVALLWPWSTTFKLGHIHPASTGELIITYLAASLIVIPLLLPVTAAQIATIIPEQRTPTPPPPTLVSIAIQPVYQPEEVMVQMGDVVTKGMLIANLVSARSTLQAPGIFDLFGTPTPLPTPTGAPLPTPEQLPAATVPPDEIAAAAADLTLAIVRATAAAAPPDEFAIEQTCNRVDDLRTRFEEKQRNECSQLAGMKNDLWRNQLTRDTARQRGDDVSAMEAGLAEQERRIGEQEVICLDLQAATDPDIELQQRKCDDITNRPHAADPEALALANAELQKAYTVYVGRVATPVPPTPKPTWTPTETWTPTPPNTPSPTPDVSNTWLYSAVNGQIYNISIEEIDQLASVVKVDIAIDSQLVPISDTVSYPVTGQGIGELATVTHVRDGDTIEVRFSDGSEEVIRLLDVNTPETVKANSPVECYGLASSGYTKEKLCGGKTGEQCVGIEVQLELAGHDRYDRALGYVWLDGSLFNEELAAQGLARYNDYGKKHQYSEQVQATADAAQAAKIGLWGACPVDDGK